MVPKYLEISESISSDIKRKNFENNEKLPAEKVLADRFHVSRETIRKALKQLIQSGQIYSLQGSGHFIRQMNVSIESTMNHFSSITDLIRCAGLVEGDMEVQISNRKPNAEEMTLLQLNENDKVFVINRIRAAMGEPIVYSINILPERNVNQEFPLHFRPGSLIKCLEHHYGITIAEALTEISAVRGDESLPYRLKQTDSPLLKFKQVHYDSKMKSIFFSIDYMKNDHIRFFVRRVKP